MLDVPKPGNTMVLIRVYTVGKEQGYNEEVSGVGLKLVKKSHADKCGHITR